MRSEPLLDNKRLAKLSHLQYPFPVGTMSPQQRLHVATRGRTRRFELGNDSPTTNDCVALSSMLHAVEQISEAP